MSGAIHFGIVAGEQSGDILGAGLIEALREHYPGARFSGVGGPAMEELGCESLAPMERLAVMGLVEPLGRLPELLRVKRRLERHFRETRPAAFIGVDAPDFNLRLAAGLHRGRIPTVHYVSPSVWAWRAGRIHGIARSIDLMLTLFPFETDIYRKHGVAVRCVGHPLADAIHPDPNQEHPPPTGANLESSAGYPTPERGMGRLPGVSKSVAGAGHPSAGLSNIDARGALARQGLGIDSAASVIALLPGSRRGEINRMAPVFLAAASAAKREFPDLEFLLPCANADSRRLVESISEAGEFSDANCRLLDNSRQAMAAADFVILASGTATLEAMLLRRPMAVCYRLAPLTYAIASRIVKVDHMAIPNLLAGARLVPEYAQHEVTRDNLLAEIRQFMADPLPDPDLLEKFSEQHRLLRGNASVEAADAIRGILAGRASA